MNKKSVVLAMSGGVDSSVAAYLLKKKGFNVIGVTFKLWQGSECKDEKQKSCCSSDSIKDAKEACAKLDIPHYVIDYAKQFKAEVIDNFLDNYRKGLTPNPCIICNERIKFPILLQQAKALGADYVATGHYARCCYSIKSRTFMIKEAIDKNKDQSYVLFSLTQAVLSRLKLPVGSYKKDKIRSIAKKLKLDSYKREESQEICFVKDDDLKRFLQENLGNGIKKGAVKDAKGKRLSDHNGTCFFTIGQRRGLRIPYGSPIYVTDIDTKTGDITIGSYADTLRQCLYVKDINWTMPLGKKGVLQNIYVKIRYKHKKSKADLKIDKHNTASIMFKKPQNALTPGQAAVFYKNNTVIGGGWIV